MMNQQSPDNEFGKLLEEQARTEGELWIKYCLGSDNPAVVQGGIFLATYFALDFQQEIDVVSELNASTLTPLQVFEAESWAKYFSNHSNEGLRGLSEFIEGWCQA
jgi:hypothetical protein